MGSHDLHEKNFHTLGPKERPGRQNLLELLALNCLNFFALAYQMPYRIPFAVLTHVGLMWLKQLTSPLVELVKTKANAESGSQCATTVKLLAFLLDGTLNFTPHLPLQFVPSKRNPRSRKFSLL